MTMFSDSGSHVRKDDELIVWAARPPSRMPSSRLVGRGAALVIVERDDYFDRIHALVIALMLGTMRGISSWVGTFSSFDRHGMVTGIPRLNRSARD
jgi:hypothetical protein